MSSSLSSRQKRLAFSWIGFFGIIFILVILVGLLVPIPHRPPADPAKRAMALAVMHDIRTAVFIYNIEYGVWPVTPSATRIHDGTADGDVRYETKAQWEELTTVLLGDKKPSQPGIDANTGLNARKISFLQVQPKSLDGDAIKDPSYAKEPAYFVLVLDANGNNITKVEADPATKNLTNPVQLNADPAIYSRNGGTLEKKKEALISWEN
jgi:hypothetical protein